MARLDRVNARVGARRSRLIGADGLRELLVQPSLEARIELLTRTGRIPPPAEREVRTLDGVEEALRGVLRADEASLLAEVEGARPRRLLAAAFGLQESQILKVLLRGTAVGVAPDRLVALAPASAVVPEERVRRLAQAASPEALAERLAAEGSPFALPMRAALAERDRAGLLPAEVALDRLAVARLADAARGRDEDARALAGWLAERVDQRNALTLLALGTGASSRELHLRGGVRLGEGPFGRLARAPLDERRRAVAALVPCGADRLADAASAERLLERAGARRLTRAARRAPLSLAVPLAWVEARREEIRSIAVVLRGAALGLAGEAILELVEA